MATKPAVLAILALVSALAAGCATPDEGSASIYVKDAPIHGFDEIHVVFTEIRVELEREDEDDVEDDDVDDSADDADSPDDGSEEGPGDDDWVVLFSDAGGVDVDLLAANGTKAAFLGESSLPAGDYDEILVTVKEAYGIRNGTRVDFVFEEKVLELDHDFLVDGGRETRLVIDFDLAGSLEREDGIWHMELEVLEIDDDEVDDDDSGEESDDEGDVRDLEDDD